jgi:hypothetical protein
MLPHTEDRQQIDGQTGPGNVDVAEHSYKRWLGVGIAFIAVAALLISGIWSRVRAPNAMVRYDKEQFPAHRPRCGGPMRVIERLTAAQIQLRSPPLPHACAA